MLYRSFVYHLLIVDLRGGDEKCSTDKRSRHTPNTNISQSLWYLRDPYHTCRALNQGHQQRQTHRRRKSETSYRFRAGEHNDALFLARIDALDFVRRVKPTHLFGVSVSVSLRRGGIDALDFRPPERPEIDCF